MNLEAISGVVKDFDMDHSDLFEICFTARLRSRYISTLNSESYILQWCSIHQKKSIFLPEKSLIGKDEEKKKIPRDMFTQ